MIKCRKAKTKWLHGQTKVYASRSRFYAKKGGQFYSRFSFRVYFFRAALTELTSDKMPTTAKQKLSPKQYIETIFVILNSEFYYIVKISIAVL